MVLFGSNLGTAEGFAHRIADDARSRGFAATVGALDEHADALPKQGAVVIVTASYNGQPPDNAAKFCQKLRDPALPSDAFAGVEYSVFGCGNRDWSATYQAIPTLIDAELEKHGAKAHLQARRRRRARRLRPRLSRLVRRSVSLARQGVRPACGDDRGESRRSAHFSQLRQPAGHEPDHAFVQRRRHDGADEP